MSRERPHICATRRVDFYGQIGSPSARGLFAISNMHEQNINCPTGGRRAMDIRSTLVELCLAFNAHDLDRIMAFFSDDCVLEMPRGSKPWGSRCEGKRDVREALATRFEGLPDVHYGDDEHFVDSSADTGISKWTLTGTTREGV